MTSIPFHLFGMLHHDPHPLLFSATTQFLHQLINHRLIRDYSSSSTLNQVKQSHAKLLVNGLQEGNTLFSEALSFYTGHSPSSNSLYCRQIFNRISNPAVSSWNSVIRIHADDDGGNWECLRLYLEMRRRGYNPDHLTFPFLLKAVAWFGKSSDAAAGVHTHVLRYGFASDGFAMTSLMKVYLNCGCLQSAYRLFDEMPVKDVASWNVLISGFSQRGFSDSAMSYFTEMRRSNCGCFPDFITVMNLMQCCCSLEVGKALHGFALKNGIERDVPVRNTMIAMYARCRANELAESVFREMAADEQTVVSWNALIAGYSYQTNSMEALRVFIIMLISSETKPDLGTMLSLFSSFADSDALLQGERVHAYAVKAGFDSYVPTCNVIMSMYSKCCRPLAAYRVFNEMKERNGISWSTMIDGFSMNGYSVKAKSLFRESDEEPDSAAVVAVLAACSMSSDLEYGTWVHNKYATQNSLLLKNIVVCNVILDMYVKCGSMKDAGIVFESMQEKNVITWTTMISGYAMNGESARALHWFREMLKTGIRPNRITFLAVLSACSHSGLVKEGLEIFSKMSTVHDVSPHMEHYACVVDLLGRKGRLKAALDFILSMPENPDSGIWASFLNACKIHHDVEMAEFAAERILELEPDDAAGHVLIASVYAGDGEWDGADRIRRMMRLKGVNKRPGYSMIFN